jgi:hypothetical protein
MEARAVVSYHPRWGRRYDSCEDHSLTPKPLGTYVFSWEMHTTSFPQRFR